jgi:sialate O-acetylesterase
MFCGAGLPTARAEVRLPKVFSSHVVLQQDKPLVIWGWAQPNETVTVTLASATAQAKANEHGEWKVVLPAMKAGGPFLLKVTGSSSIELEDVMIGEVWLCSGQSNMEMGLGMARDAQKDIAQADDPGLRLLLVARKWDPLPQTNIDGQWKVCSPKTIAEGGWNGFSAAAYFFGRDLRQKLGVTVGLIESSWGGTRIEPWTPPEGFAATPALRGEYEKLAPPHDLQNAAALYNGMIHPLCPFALRGAIWYQGEGNLGDGPRYTERMKALIGGWRELWKQGDFPFYFVQIAPFNYGGNPQAEAEFWEAQAATQAIPNTGMAVINDIGDLKNIHPKNKQDVGHRLALLALAKTYHHDGLAWSGPVFKSLSIKGDKLRVTFDHAEGGLASRDGKPLDWFEIIDANKGGFVQADARLDGSSVVLSAPDVKHPVAVRYAWSMLAEPHLINGAGLPAGAFRAGTVPARP